MPFVLAPNVTSQVFGENQGLLFALGALASVAYVILLEKTADDVASGKQDVATKLKGDARFAVPVLLVASLALKNYLSDPGGVVLFKLIPKEEFAAAMIGFIAPARLPLLYREFKSSLKGDEVLDMLPGSLGQGRAILRSMGEPSGTSAGVAEEAVGPSLTRVIVVSGPKCLGKTSLVNKILAEDDRLAQPPWCTTRPMRSSEAEGEDAFFMKQVKFEEFERKGAFLHVYKDSDGESYGLRLEDILAVAEKGKVGSSWSDLLIICFGQLSRLTAVCWHSLFAQNRLVFRSVRTCFLRTEINLLTVGHASTFIRDSGASPYRPASATSVPFQVCIVDANMDIVRALTGVGDLALIGVWVSLDSIEAIEDRIRTTLISGGAAKDPSLDADVRGLVRQAVEDIEFGVMSGVFDFTVINNSDVEESMETVRRAVEFATAK